MPSRWITAITCLLCVAAGLRPHAAQAGSGADTTALAVTIYRDTYGVPHIYGPTDAAVVFGLMYAQAEDNFWQLEDTYIRALGRAAEIYGERELLSDLLHRAFEVEQLARAEYQRAGPYKRAICDAFAAGLNYFLEKNPQVKPRLITRFEPWFIFAMERGVSRAPLTALGVRPEAMFRAMPEVSSGSVGPPAPPQADVGADPRGRPSVPTYGELDEGSNMWAIAPAKSATGHAMLLINPHVGFFGGGQRYEAHLNSRTGLHVSGFAILGTPYIRSGHNEHLGWSHTNNYADIADVYAEKFDDPARPLAYRYGGGHRMATAWIGEVKVKTEKGVEARRFHLRKTHHGPVVAIHDGQVLTLRPARFEEGGVMDQRLAMARSRSLAEFRAAMARRALTGSNTIYADRRGNIFYIHGNVIPRRHTKFDWSRPVDGSDPETEWRGYHEFSELPQLLNPAGGFLQNCNSTAFLMAGDGNLAPGLYPAYMAPESDNGRAQISRRLLESKSKFSFEDWARAALDTTVLRAETEIPLLVDEWEKLRKSDAARAARLAEAVKELTAWNRVSTNDSVAMTLFMRWQEPLLRSRPARDPAMRDAGEQAAPRSNMEALEQAIGALEKDFGAWRVPWGEVNRLQRVHTSGAEEAFSDEKPSVPVPGAPGAAGIVFVFNTRTEKGMKRRYGISGNTYISVVEFAPKVRARSLLVFGQSAHPKSPHFFDQARLYSEQRLKPAWFYLDEVKKNAERVYHPGEQEAGSSQSAVGGGRNDVRRKQP